MFEVTVHSFTKHAIERFNERIRPVGFDESARREMLLCLSAANPNDVELRVNGAVRVPTGCCVTVVTVLKPMPSPGAGERKMRVIGHGPSVGEHKGRPIPAYIVRDDGNRFEFRRIAAEDGTGGVEMAQLDRSECLLAPGLIYGPNPVR